MAAKSAIERANAAFQDMYKKGDWDGVGQLYTQDCKLMAPGHDLAEGRATAAKAHAQLSADGLVALDSTIDEIIPLGADSAIERAHWKGYGKDGSVRDEGQYVVFWKKQDGQWRMHYDILNSSRK